MTKTLWIIIAGLTIVGTVYIAAWMSVPVDRRTGLAEALVTDYVAAAAEVDSTRLRTTITRLS